MRGQEFFVLTRRERRAYPSAVCKERATRSARKRTAARWVAPHWAWGVVAPQSQSAGGYAPSSRLAPGPMRRNACIDNSVPQYQSGKCGGTLRSAMQAMQFVYLSGLRHKYDDVRGKGFFAQTRRERRAYPAVDL